MDLKMSNTAAMDPYAMDTYSVWKEVRKWGMGDSSSSEVFPEVLARMYGVRPHACRYPFGDYVHSHVVAINCGGCRRKIHDASMRLMQDASMRSMRLRLQRMHSCHWPSANIEGGECR